MGLIKNNNYTTSVFHGNIELRRFMIRVYSMNCYQIFYEICRKINNGGMIYEAFVYI